MWKRADILKIPDCSPYHLPHQGLTDLQPVPLGFDRVIPQQEATYPVLFPAPPPQTMSINTATTSNNGPLYPATSTFGFTFDANSNRIEDQPPKSPLPRKEALPIFPIRPALRDLADRRTNEAIHILFLYEEAAEDNNVVLKDHWRSPDFARLPTDPENSVILTELKKQILHRKWNIMKTEWKKLEKLIASRSLDMGQAGNQIHSSVVKYNAAVVDTTFNLLNSPRMSDTLRKAFPSIVSSALEMETLFPSGIPILRKGKGQTLFFTQRQIRCVLANAFLSSFPKRMEFAGQELGDINFFRLLDGGPRADSKQKFEKLRCILNYFERGPNRPETDGVISFQRLQLQSSTNAFPNWRTSNEKMSRVSLHIDPLLLLNEDFGDMLQINFATPFVGGDFFGPSTTVDEIMPCLSPEILAARLFTEKLTATEALVITGFEKYSNHSGYSEHFEFLPSDPPSPDLTPVDELGRRGRQLLLVEGYFPKGQDFNKQYEPSQPQKELNKFFGVIHSDSDHKGRPVFCGTWPSNSPFNGDAELKFLLQWMAASCNQQREMHFYSPGDKEFGDRVMKMVRFLSSKENCSSVGSIYSAIEAFHSQEIKSSSFFKNQKTLFQFLEKHFK